jgi:hypothetical protein
MDHCKSLYTDAKTEEALKALAKATGLSQSRIFRKLVAMAVARFEKEQSAAFLLPSE